MTNAKEFIRPKSRFSSNVYKGARTANKWLFFIVSFHISNVKIFNPTTPYNLERYRLC